MFAGLRYFNSDTMNGSEARRTLSGQLAERKASLMAEDSVCAKQ